MPTDGRGASAFIRVHLQLQAAPLKACGSYYTRRWQLDKEEWPSRDGGALVCVPKATVQPWIMQIVSALNLPEEVELFE
jgi:hypothetical protein